MAVSKRVRYEILKRDDYTCRYDDPHCLYGLGHSVGEDFGSQCTYTLFHDAIWHYKTCPEVNHG